MPDFDEDDARKGAIRRTCEPKLAQHDFAREGGLDRVIYDLELRQDIKLAWQELDFKARLEAVLEEIRRHQIAEPERRQKPGPKPTQFERVADEMRETEHGAEYLRAMKLVEMEETYKASTHTCWRARRAVIRIISN
jgi:hypothetical protein